MKVQTQQRGSSAVQHKIGACLQQIKFLAIEASLKNSGRWWRWLGCWFTPAFWVIASYRFDRSCHLLFGRAWPVLRIGLAPVRFITHPWRGHSEIHYGADIGQGLRILHPALPVVVSKHLVAGKNLTLIGGNMIGGRRDLEEGDLIIGHNVELGVYAVVLGPSRIGDNVKIGAGTVVLSDAEDNAVLFGMPARRLQNVA